MARPEETDGAKYFLGTIESGNFRVIYTKEMYRVRERGDSHIHNFQTNFSGREIQFSSAPVSRARKPVGYFSMWFIECLDDLFSLFEGPCYTLGQAARANN
jgi:hypothetical protein